MDLDIRVVPVRDFVIVYNSESDQLDEKRSGRWIYFSKDSELGSSLARSAVRKNIVAEAKYMRSGAGPVSFYLNADDRENHRTLISWFLEKDLLPKDREGNLREQRFIPDSGAVIGRDIVLSDFVDLATGKLR